MSWPEDMDVLRIKFLSFVSFFCSVNLSCFMIANIFKRQKLSGGGHKFSQFACFVFCFVYLVSFTYWAFHDSSYIKRQTLYGGGHKFSEFACFKINFSKHSSRNTIRV